MKIQSFAYLFSLLGLWFLARRLHSARARQVFFLLVSYLFYATWGLGFLAVLVLSSVVNYSLGIYLRRQPSALRLWVSVAFNLLLLCFFKYLPSLAGWAPADSLLGQHLRAILMPVGVSFWTFQALSYLFDLYREEKLDPSLLEFCLFMAFWPTVLSGPVCRLSNLLPQFRQTSNPTRDDVTAGVARLAIGLFMKIVLAQLLDAGFQVGRGVSAGFDQVRSGWGGADVWLLAVGFGFQLYFDFAGYSHMVIGTARLFGIRLDENFNHPYTSTTPAVFWTRWHMSLSFWIRDYVFLPLATARREAWWRYVALVISMTLFGVWHKASVLLILWGVYQGLLLLVHRLIQQIKRWRGITSAAYLETPVSWVLTFAAISIGWVLFRANDLRQAAAMLKALMTPGSYGHAKLPFNLYLVVFLMASGYFLLTGLLPRTGWPRTLIGTRGPQASTLEGEQGYVSEEAVSGWPGGRWAWLAAMILAILVYTLMRMEVRSSEMMPFIYTQF